MPSSAAPRASIGTWPTPIRRMDRVSDAVGREVWFKVEEECGAWGGNKVRKLEYILAAAARDGIDTLVSYGAGTSNWTAALAYHASRSGFRVVVGAAGPVPATYARLYDQTQTKVIASRSSEALPFVIAGARVAAGAGARSIPMGGSGYGDIGCVQIGREIADEVASGGMPQPDEIFVALGTSGTAAGTAVGLALAGRSIPLVAVQVAPWPFGTASRVRSHARKLLARLKTDVALRVSVDRRFFKPGYARPNAASSEAAEIAALDGVVLDGTYTAKAFAALVDRARTQPGGPLLFIHTAPGPPPFAPAPPLRTDSPDARGGREEER